MIEYLKDFRDPSIEKFKLEGILESGEPIPREVLLDYLIQANRFLTLTQGPNLFTRKEIVPTWLGWWIDFLNKSDPNDDCGKIAPIENIHNLLEKGKSSGVLFAAGLEGLVGHRSAVDWMITNVDNLVLILEQENYLAKKDRGAPLLELGARISMWAYYNSRIIVSVGPVKESDISEKDHYQTLFNLTKADYCFATEGDPNLKQKIARGKKADFLVIPFINTPPTSNAVKRLFEDMTADPDDSLW